MRKKRPRPGKSHRHLIGRSCRLLVPGQPGATYAERRHQAGLYIKHFLKDMRIAIESAEEMGLDLPGLCLAKKLYDQLAGPGHGKLRDPGLVPVV